MSPDQESSFPIATLERAPLVESTVSLWPPRPPQGGEGWGEGLWPSLPTAPEAEAVNLRLEARRLEHRRRLEHEQRGLPWSA